MPLRFAPLHLFHRAAPTFVAAALLISSAGAAQVARRDTILAAATGGTRQSVTVRPTLRRYTVAGTTVTERAADLAYGLTAGPVRVRLNGGPVRFSAGATTINGALPVEARGDIRLGRADTLQLSARTSSLPGTLDSRQVAALGSVGTATIDLESIAFGTPMGAGAGIVVNRPLGSLIATARLRTELEPRPHGADSVYWRGATIRGGLGLTGFTGDFRVSGEATLSRSFADSLDGRNLFPGGGALTLRVSASGLVSTTTAALVDFSAFYFRPFSLARPNLPNRLIPVGALSGASAGLLLPAGELLVSPILSLTRESSTAEVTDGAQRIQFHGSGWAMAGSVAVDVPLAAHLAATPEVGFAAGAVGTEFLATDLRPLARLPGIRAAFSDPLHGWWAAVEFSIRW